MKSDYRIKNIEVECHQCKEKRLISKQQLYTINKKYISGLCKKCSAFNVKVNKNKKGVGSFNRLIRSYKKNSINKNRKFALTNEEFRKITSSNCHYCGKKPLSVIKSNNGDYVYNGIDRKDNNIGYELDNCLPCCTECNFSKGNLSYEDFINHIKQSFEYMKSKGII